MRNEGTSLTAHTAFELGSALVDQGRYGEALPELLSAEALFRRIDIEGHPFTRTLANGVSGLANTLFLIGLCHQKLGNCHQAVQHYESSFINSKFEISRRFAPFAASVNENLLLCYEQLRSELPQDKAEQILNSDPAVDTSCQFPFSLDTDAVVFARLFELSPQRHDTFRPFYLRAKEKDNARRKREKRSDEASMRKLSVLIWSGLLIIWAVYGIFVVKTLTHTK